jgi:hypothetical protein
MCAAALLAAAPATTEAQSPDPAPAPVSQGPSPDPAPQAAPTASAPVTSAPAPVPSAPAPAPTAAPRRVARAPVAQPRATTRVAPRPEPRPAPKATRPHAPRHHAARHHTAQQRSEPRPAAAPYPGRPYATESGIAVRSLRAPDAVGAGGGSADTRLILQIGMLFSLVYVAFLCVWFRATRHLRADGGESAFALARRRARVWLESVDAGFRSPPERRPAVRRETPAPEEGDARWTCEIAYQPGQLRFQAVMAPDDAAGHGTDTKVLHWPRGVPKPSAHELESAMGALFASIAAAGWEPVRSAGVWSERRFVWRKAGEPPTSFELVGTGIEAGMPRPVRPRAPRGANREAVLRTVAARPGLTQRELTKATGVRPSSLPPLLRTLTLRGELEKLRLPNGQTGYALARPIEQPAEAGEELQPTS